MNFLNLLIKGIRNPHHVPSFIHTLFRAYFDRYVRRRMRFTHKEVVTGVSNYAEFSSRLYMEVQLLKKALKDYSAQRSLEVGCGYARLTPWIAEYSKEHHAVDAESKLLKDAQMLYPRVQFHKATVQNLPFPNNYFALCVSWTVLQHIPPEELPRAVREMKRVLKANGIFIMAEETDNITALDTWGHSLEEWKELLSPWKLVWHTERKVETTHYRKYAGMVMRFERS
jgi:ubiquinone/menaquinone biosynthesis C-methylase UbiE